MEKFIVDRSQRKAFAHAKRISNIEVKKEDYTELQDGRVAYSITISVEEEKSDELKSLSY